MNSYFDVQKDIKDSAVTSSIDSEADKMMTLSNTALNQTGHAKSVTLARADNLNDTISSLMSNYRSLTSNYTDKDSRASVSTFISEMNDNERFYRDKLGLKSNNANNGSNTNE